MTDCGGGPARRLGNSESVREPRILRKNGTKDCCGEAAATNNAGRVCSPELPAWRPHVKFESLHRKGLQNQNPLSA